jgi:hypothetical protein
LVRIAHSWLKRSQADGILILNLEVPPIILAFLANKELVEKYDLSSATDILTGAAPLGAETYGAMAKTFPRITVREGYGKYDSLHSRSCAPCARIC